MKKNTIKTAIIVFLLFGSTNLTNAQWTQVGSDIIGDFDYDWFGSSVCLSSDGSILAIGASKNDDAGVDAGKVRIYQNTAGSWVQIGNDINGEAAGDRSGIGLSLSSDGSIVAIGAPDNDGVGGSAGHVRIFEYNGSSWIQLGSDIDAEAADDYSGQEISLSSDGSIVAIGAIRNDGNGNYAGHVRIFQYNGSNWIQMGSDIDGEAADDLCGTAVSLSSNGLIVAVGATENDGSFSNAGHVRIYEFDGSNWIQMGSDIDGEAANDGFGRSTSLSADGRIVAAGARENDGSYTDAGHVRIYEYNGSNWIQMGSDIDGEYYSDESGIAVGLSYDASIVAIGAQQNDGGGANSGHVRTYRYSGGAWVKFGDDIDGDAAGSNLGCSVSLSSNGGILAIGAFRNTGSAVENGQVKIFTTNTYSVIDEEECGSYNSPSGNYTWMSSGTYLDTIPNVAGFDSIITINLTIFNLPAVNIVGDTASCGSTILDEGFGIPGDQYIWSTGETTQIITVSSTDYYSLTVTDGSGCNGSDTVHVSVYDIYSFLETYTICSSDSVYWQGNYYNITGDYFNSFSSIHGCDSIYELQLTVYNNPVVNIVGDTTSCGSTILDEGFGIPGDQYIWSTGETTQFITVSSTDYYSLTVTDGSGCNGSDTVHVSVYDIYSFLETDTICSSDSVFWQGNYYNVTGGYFNSFTSIHGCDSIYELQLTVYNDPVVNIIGDTASCGATILDEGFGIPGDQYIWSTGDTTQIISVTTTGAYSLTVTDGSGCIGSDLVSVTIYNIPVIDLGIDTVLCDYETIILDVGTGFGDIVWSTGDTTQTVLIDSSYGGLGVFIVSVELTDTNGCYNSDTIQVTFDDCVGITNYSVINAYIYPNPTTGKITIQAEEVESIEVINIQGEVVIRQKTKVKSKKLEVDISNQAKGIYIIKVWTDYGVAIGKVVLE
ncbi:MAG: T9SS type A sorting domain-containing protein [Bacteroidota bacterium]